jgi:peptidoglycan hydrolase-like protein with peptidoglycan-binding domain
VEQWFQNTRGLVIVVLAVITGAVLLAVEPGDGFPSGVSSSSGGESPTVTTPVTTVPGSGPGATTTTVAHPQISQGTADVANTTLLQTNLLRLGYTGVGTPDGNFGPNTTTAVKQFQTDKGLPSTGVVDAATWNALLNTTSPTTTTTK